MNHRFHKVVITGLAHVEGHRELTTQDINMRLADTRKRLGINTDALGTVVGVKARRLWNEGTTVDEVATEAGEKALKDAGIASDDVGLLLNTSVSRDYLEPATAAIVAGQLGVSSTCQSFDIANACLAFVSGMDMASLMIERGACTHALIVDAENANPIYEHTLARLSKPETTQEQFRDELASMTLGSGAVAMVLSHIDYAPDAPRYLGGVTRSATQWHNLCRGNLDKMTTDTKQLMIAGMALASETWHAAQSVLGWNAQDMDHFICHQVSKPHTKGIIKSIGIDPSKVMTIFEDHGNLGPASVPTVLSKLRDNEKLHKGERIALLGIGSGLNCTMAEICW